MNEMQRERLSMWMDDAAEPQEGRAISQHLLQDPEAREVWTRYHLIGDALRGLSLGPDGGQALAARVRESLQHEPALLVPRAARPSRLAKAWPAALSALAASVVVVAILWMPGGQAPQGVPSVTGGGLAQVAPANPTPAAPVPGERWAAYVVTQGDGHGPLDPRLNAYLVNHQGYVPATQIRGVLPSATLVGTDARR